MEERMSNIKDRLKVQIESSKLQSDAKDRMSRILDAIFLSPNGKLYFERKPDFQEYLTLARNKFSENYDFTIVKRMVDNQRGSTEGRDYEFPSLVDLSSRIEAHKDIMESEIINAQNHARAQQSQQSYENSPKTPIEEYTENAKSAVADASNIPDYQKQRAYDLMDLLAQLPSGKIYTEQGNNYSKAIALSQTKSGYGYHIVTRFFDEYSGATISRDDTPISAVGLTKYANEHRVELDKKMKIARDELSSPKGTKKINGDER